MGAWGTEVWQDDVADDVLIMFEDLIEAGITPIEAVRLIILDPPWGWGDYDDEPTQVLALAALSVKYKILTTTLRHWAIATIRSGVALWDEEGVDPKNVAARADVLERFKAILLRGTATAEELESVTGPQRV